MTNWEAQVAGVWARADEISPDEVVEQMTRLVAQRPQDDAAALFELASAYDFADREADAEPLYRRAVAAGLDGERRGQAVIQLASTLRNLGRAQESVDLLRREIAETPADELADARTAFLALALASAGRPEEALAEALRALVVHLPSYGRAVRAYADELAPGLR